MNGYIARRNVSFKMTDVIQLTRDAIAAVAEDDRVSSCRHVEEVERKYWVLTSQLKRRWRRSLFRCPPVTRTQTRQQGALTIRTQNQQTKCTKSLVAN